MTGSLILSGSAINSEWREKRGQEKVGNRTLEPILGSVSPSTQDILISGPDSSNLQT